MTDGPTGWRAWVYKGAGKALKVSDYVGGHANAVGAKFGTERFWPTSGDYVQELEKCERILRSFTVKGIPTEEASPSDATKKRKVFRKIPPQIIREAKGIVIFNAMRTGIAPFSGAGGGGVVLKRLPNGDWSAPSFLSPNNMGVGLMLGLDVYSAILVLRTDQAVQGFATHHVTLGGEMGVAAGPLGYGMSAETGLKHRTPIYSYIVSHGLYAGVGIVGQVFIDRFDENERVYNWPGIKAGDIFSGRARRPYESASLYKALSDAELGIAQGSSLEWDTDEVRDLQLEEGEVLKLPPTPDQLRAYEAAGIMDEEDIKAEQEERKLVRAMPPPPKHPHARNTAMRGIDSQILTGRRGMRSPDPGKSASECTTPETPETSCFSSPIEEMSPHMQRYHKRDFMEPTEIPLPPSNRSSIEAHHALTTHFDGLGIRPIGEEHTPVDSTQAPKLQHMDSTASETSLYSDAASDTTAPIRVTEGKRPEV